MPDPQHETVTLVAQVLGWFAAMGTACLAIAKTATWVTRGLRSRATAKADDKRTDAAIAQSFRDELWDRSERLFKRVETLESSIDEVRDKLRDCEEARAECEREKNLLHSHAEARELVISELTDRVRAIEKRLP